MEEPSFATMVIGAEDKRRSGRPISSGGCRRDYEGGRDRRETMTRGICSGA
jgi:hypothetical protein